MSDSDNSDKSEDTIEEKLRIARASMYENGYREYKIPWNFVDLLLKAGASGYQAAALLGIHEDTLYNACRRDHNQEFRQYKATKKEAGKALLMLSQFQKMLDGDNTMLVWLGKQWLGQRDKPLELQGENEGFTIFEMVDNGRSVKDQNPNYKPIDDADDPEAPIDTSGYD